MTRNGPSTPPAPLGSASAWGLRHPGLSMAKGRNAVTEFTGMWPLRPDADLHALTRFLVPGGWVHPKGESFAAQTTRFGMLRSARWFVARTRDFDGHTLFFVAQFDGTLERFFDHFTLNGRENLQAIWGHCVGCPAGADVTARDLVEFIARGQLKTLACYDVAPSISIGQMYKTSDWYEKTQRFQRAVTDGDGSLEEKVSSFLAELAEPYSPVPSDVSIDATVARERQYEDVADRLRSRSSRRA
jgi:hypothetical protein